MRGWCRLGNERLEKEDWSGLGHAILGAKFWYAFPHRRRRDDVMLRLWEEGGSE